MVESRRTSLAFTDRSPRIIRATNSARLLPVELYHLWKSKEDGYKLGA